MPALYFFHAPDGRVYGPVDFATLQRWRQEGRVRDESDLREEKEGPRLTYADLAARPPLPEPAPAPPPVLAAEPEVIEEAAEEAPLSSVGEIVRQAIALYWRGFRLLWPVAAVIQLPLLVVYGVALRGMTPAKDLHSVALQTPGKRELLLFLALSLISHAFNAWGAGLLTDLAVDLEETGAARFRKSWDVFRSRFGALLKTWLLGGLIVLSWLIVGNLLRQGIAYLPVGAALQQILDVASLFPAILFALRYLIAPQVVMIEGIGGLPALKRSIDLVRHHSGANPFSSGDLRLVFLLAAALVATVCATSLLSILASVLPQQHLAAILTLVLYLSIATVTPFLALLLTLYTIDAQRRVAARRAAASAGPSPLGGS